VADPRRTLGAAGEDLVARWYVSRGFRVLDRNWRVRGGELDLVVTDGSVLVFCEVKARTSERFGSGLEAVTLAKQQRLRRLAAQWLAASESNRAAAPRPRLRFDVAALLVRPDRTELRVVEGAF
jgi:putative endonuclease